MRARDERWHTGGVHNPPRDRKKLSAQHVDDGGRGRMPRGGGPPPPPMAPPPPPPHPHPHKKNPPPPLSPAPNGGEQVESSASSAARRREAQHHTSALGPRLRGSVCLRPQAQGTSALGPRLRGSVCLRPQAQGTSAEELEVRPLALQGGAQGKPGASIMHATGKPAAAEGLAPRGQAEHSGVDAVIADLAASA